MKPKNKSSSILKSVIVRLLKTISPVFNRKMKWIEALAEFNSHREAWCVPRKGTPEHAEVVRIMGGTATAKATPAKSERKSPVASGTSTAMATPAKSEYKSPIASPEKKPVGRPRVRPSRAKSAKALPSSRTPVMSTQKSTSSTVVFTALADGVATPGAKSTKKVTKPATEMAPVAEKKRKVRSDKGKKRGPRKVKCPEE